MEKIVIFLLVLFMFVCGGCGTTNQENINVDMTPRLISITSDMGTSEMVEAVTGAVVGISSKIGWGLSIGSGVAIAGGGYIITNQHVVENNSIVTIYLADKSTSNAEVIWSNTGLDIAVLKAEVNLPYLQTSPLSNVNVGDEVIAIGTPLSLQFRHSVTKGIVSALYRTLEVENVNGSISIMQDLIQHDASINSGNSGGPLIDTSGRVIGINALKAADSEGIGFAIPIEIATAATVKIIPDNAYATAYLGVLGCDAEIANYNGDTDAESGIYIMDIAENSPLKNSDIRIGDVIIRVNSNIIDNMLDFQKAVIDIKPNSEVELDYIQDGAIKTEVIISN
ncbi:MAG: trypsin-like peptidase domain-containing protein [Clostridia bacterium]|nr:trypsin-like peptidase domain-containing protein [Clostridia bacterium]MDD4685996.1 trypsin-like peptidase domain-containing protein [Clostridia bacterium]